MNFIVLSKAVYEYMSDLFESKRSPKDTILINKKYLPTTQPTPFERPFSTAQLVGKWLF